MKDFCLIEREFREKAYKGTITISLDLALCATVGLVSDL